MHHGNKKGRACCEWDAPPFYSHRSANERRLLVLLISVPTDETEERERSSKYNVVSCYEREREKKKDRNREKEIRKVMMMMILKNFD